MAERIQLLPDEEILKWWKAQVENDEGKSKSDRSAQDNLRRAVKDGIVVQQGSMVLVSAKKYEIYQAIEVLLREGLLHHPQQPRNVEPAPPIRRQKQT